VDITFREKSTGNVEFYVAALLVLSLCGCVPSNKPNSNSVLQHSELKNGRRLRETFIVLRQFCCAF